MFQILPETEDSGRKVVSQIYKELEIIFSLMLIKFDCKSAGLNQD